MSPHGEFFYAGRGARLVELIAGGRHTARGLLPGADCGPARRRRGGARGRLADPSPYRLSPGTHHRRYHRPLVHLTTVGLDLVWSRRPARDPSDLFPRRVPVVRLLGLQADRGRCVGPVTAGDLVCHVQDQARPLHAGDPAEPGDGAGVRRTSAARPRHGLRPRRHVRCHRWRTRGAHPAGSLSDGGSTRFCSPSSS